MMQVYSPDRWITTGRNAVKVLLRKFVFASLGHSKDKIFPVSSKNVVKQVYSPDVGSKQGEMLCFFSTGEMLFFLSNVFLGSLLVRAWVTTGAHYSQLLPRNC